MSANMKPQGGKSIQGPLLRGLAARSVTGQNGQAAKDELSAVWQGGWMPENISGVPAGRSVFHLTSPLIGLLDNLREGGLADRLLLRITCEMGISQHLSSPTLLHDNLRAADQVCAPA